jgi:hypothetical protein
MRGADGVKIAVLRKCRESLEFIWAAAHWRTFGDKMKIFSIFIILIHWFCMVSVASDKMVYRPVPKETIVQMDKQRSFIGNIVSKHFPKERIYGNKKDFYLIQKIVDSKIFKKNQTWQLQCLGIVFGDALLDYIDGLAWWEVTDEYGTDPVLRYKLSTLQISALTMISKRIEDNEEIDILHMADWLKDFIKNRDDEYR